MSQDFLDVAVQSLTADTFRLKLVTGLAKCNQNGQDLVVLEAGGNQIDRISEPLLSLTKLR